VSGAVKGKMQLTVLDPDLLDVIHVAAREPDEASLHVGRARTGDFQPPGVMARLFGDLDVPASVEAGVAGERRAGRYDEKQHTIAHRGFQGLIYHSRALRPVETGNYQRPLWCKHDEVLLVGRIPIGSVLDYGSWDRGCPRFWRTAPRFWRTAPKIKICVQVFDFILAVRVGFEPTEPVKVQRFSRPPDSTTLAPHRLTGLLPL